jgi:hypothetical protein
MFPKVPIKVYNKLDVPITPPQSMTTPNLAQTSFHGDPAFLYEIDAIVFTYSHVSSCKARMHNLPSRFASQI